MTQNTRPSEGMRRSYQRLTAAFSGAPLTLPQTALLRALHVLGPSNQTALVDATGIDRSTLSEMIRRLVLLEAVSAVRSDEDAREKRVAVTAKGRSLLKKAENLLFLAEADMMRLVPERDREVFTRALRAIAEAA
jgi:DNA-binding MarR family transcriptional regulator